MSSTRTPCPNAKEIDVTPTKGAETYAGANLKSPAAMREKSRDQLVEAVRPLTGLDQKGFDVFERRRRLTATAQQDCKVLDRDLPKLELTQRETKGKEGDAAAEAVYQARLRFKNLGC